MSICRRRTGRCGSWRVETSSGELKYGVDLFARYIKLLNDFVYAGSGFKVVEDGGCGHPGITKHPSAAQSTRRALYGGALGPIERGHLLPSFHRTPYKVALVLRQIDRPGVVPWKRIVPLRSEWQK
jgi:hypothetical protein